MAEFKPTAQQREAIESEGGALLVSAAAGSGKTRVLVDRVMRRLCDPADPRHINEFLIITYTEAASAELRGKLARAIGEALAAQPGSRHLQRQLSRIYLAQISTVHAFCKRVLHDYAHECDLYPDFRVAEEQDAALWMEQAMSETLAAAYDGPEALARFGPFLDQLGAGRGDDSAALILMQLYRSSQCHPDPRRWREECRAMLAPPSGRMEDTPWGRFLMDSFFTQLDDQIAAVARGMAQLETEPAVGAKYSAVYTALLAQLRSLRAASTWDEVRERRILAHPRLPAVKQADKETRDLLAAPRNRCKDWLARAQAPFALSSAEGLAELRASGPVIDGMLGLLEDFTARYDAIKQRNRALDFNDLEHLALRLLTRADGSPSAIAREVRGRFAEVMVDEYQDSNQVQDCIFRAVSDEGRNLFMVGDVKQSIYRFRLADPDIFLQKYRAFVPFAQARAGESRRVVLSQNFRSCSEILSAVNDIFRLTMTPEVGGLRYGPDEALYPGPNAALPPLGQPRVELHVLDTAAREDDTSARELEARLVAQRIAQLLRDGTPVQDADGPRPVRPSDIVILLRSHRANAPAYLSALRREGIEAASGESDDILQTSEVSVLLSYLQVLDNPHQDIPLLSVLLSPVFGFDADAVAQVRAGRTGDFYDALCADAAERDTFVPFLAQLAALRQAAREEPVGSLIRRVWAQTRLRDIFAALPGGAQRAENLQTIYLLACGFDPEGPGRLHDFLRKLERMRSRGITAATAQQPEAVRILSIHKSKGLEFPVVIAAGLSTRFNTSDEQRSVQTHPDLGIGCDVVDLALRVRYPSLAKQAIVEKLRQERLSEELRVLYVALTRPKDLLIMTCAPQFLSSTLKNIAQRLTPDGPVSLARDAACLGHWVLMAAMARPEAGELFARGAQPAFSQPGTFPWRIRVWTPDQLGTQAPLPAAPADLPPEPLPELVAPLSYPHAAATTAAAKLTATQLKGRFKDEESAQEAPAHPARETFLRQPIFLQGKRPLSPSERGTSVHLAMQYLRYERCTDEAAVAAELQRLVTEGFLLEEQAACVAPGKLMALFRSALGRRILAAPEVVREFKFSLLTDAGAYDPALAGEEVLLQGVTDCCLLEPGGLCVIDFKTDRVAPGSEAARAEVYRGQLEAYSLALSRIFGQSVREKILYFFATDTAVSLPEPPASA